METFSTEAPRLGFGRFKLIRPAIVVPGCSQEFDPCEYFLGRQAWYSIDDSFYEHVLSLATAICAVPKTLLSLYALAAPLSDREIIAAFGWPAPAFSRERLLWIIAAMTFPDEGSERLTLSSNGNETIFDYIPCADGIVRSVRIRFDNDECSWNCACEPLRGEHECFHVLFQKVSQAHV